MTDSNDYRRFLPTVANPRVEAIQGRDAHEHGAAGLAHPFVRDLLFTPWEALYREPFVGVTVDGNPLRGLFELGANGAPTTAMVDAAVRLIDDLPAELRAALLLPVDAGEWRRWNNTEMYAYKYGLRLDEVSASVRDGVLAVLKGSLSNCGFEKTRDVMRLNHFLGELVGNTRVLGEWSYNFTMFGLPSANQPWGWQLAGHHLSLNCLVIGNQMVMTPCFMGAEPNYADVGPFAGTRLFESEERLGLELVRGLTEGQRRQAILFPSNFRDRLPPERHHLADHLHLGGAFQDNRVVPYEGVPAVGFSRQQRLKLLDLVKAHIEPLPQGPQAARMEEVERHLPYAHFCWIGGTGEDDTFYYRLQSPVVMIEFDHHSGVFLNNELPAKFHIHTIVRTPNGNDYGADLLRQHYLRDHGPGAQPGVSAADIDHRRSARGSHVNHPRDPRSHTHDGHTHSHDASGATRMGEGDK
jgi:hypothetical protein